MVITVTGSTGTIGSELVRLLSEADAAIRAVYRHANKVRDLPNVAWVRADLADSRMLEAVLAGSERLFVLSDNMPGFGAQQIALIIVAESLGARHVVKLSALGASGHSNSSIAREHYMVEQALQQQSAMTWTMLRPHAFMQNWLGDVAASVRTEGVIRSAIGDGRVPFIDTRDIAAVAAKTLLEPEAHAGKKYFLTGPEAVGYADLATVLSEVTGRRVTYQPITMDEERARLEAQRVPPTIIDAMLAMATYQSAGGATSTVSDRV